MRCPDSVTWVFQFEFTLLYFWHTNYIREVQKNFKQVMVAFKVWELSFTMS